MELTAPQIDQVQEAEESTSRSRRRRPRPTPCCRWKSRRQRSSRPIRRRARPCMKSRARRASIRHGNRSCSGGCRNSKAIRRRRAAETSKASCCSRFSIDRNGHVVSRRIVRGSGLCRSRRRGDGAGRARAADAGLPGEHDRSAARFDRADPLLAALTVLIRATRLPLRSAARDIDLLREWGFINRNRL